MALNLPELHSQRTHDEHGGKASVAGLGGRVNRSPHGYQMREVLGSGGCAVVYLATEAATGRQVALKIMQECSTARSERVARFRRELSTAARLKHENVVRVLHTCDEGETPFMAMELVEGGTLRELLSRVGSLPPLLAAMLGEDLLGGLAHVHAQGLVHRDIKPDNLLLTKDGHLKLSDFGVASSSDEVTLTAPGEIIGTPSYMSPEQALGLPVGVTSDLFSAGTVLYEMLTGFNPFSRETQAQTLSGVCASDAKPIFEVDPTVPPGFERLLDVMIEADPTMRCQSANDALAMLRAARAEMNSTPGSVARRIVAAPRETVDTVRRNQARVDLAAAQAIKVTDESTAARAAFLAFRANLLANGDPVALELRTSLSTRFGFHFCGEPSSTLAALERMIRDAPGAFGLLKRAGMVARMEGDLLRSAELLKRYLRTEPGDDDARIALASIVGADLGVPAARRCASVRVAIDVTSDTIATANPSATRSVALTRLLGDEARLAALAAAIVAIAATGNLVPALTAAVFAWFGVGALGVLHPLRRVVSPVADTIAHRQEDASTVPPAAVESKAPTPRAFAAALRSLARQGWALDSDRRADALLERAACSLALEERDAALTDLEAAIAVMPEGDGRKRCVSDVTGRLRGMQGPRRLASPMLCH